MRLCAAKFGTWLSSLRHVRRKVWGRTAQSQHGLACDIFFEGHRARAWCEDLCAHGSRRFVGFCCKEDGKEPICAFATRPGFPTLQVGSLPV